MGILSSLSSVTSKVVSTAKSVGSTLKTTFLPSEKEGAARREKVFGTESKAVTTGAVLGTAAGLIAAPAVISSAAGGAAIKAAGSAVVKAVAGSSLKTKVVGSLVGTALLGAASQEPEIVKKAPSKITKAVSSAYQGTFQLGGDIGSFANEPTTQNFMSIFTENPTASAVAGGALLLTGGGIAAKTLAPVVGTYLATKAATSQGTSSILNESFPDSQAIPNQVIPTESKTKVEPLPTTLSTSKDVPITPQTQVLGKSAGTSIRKYKRKKPSKDYPRQYQSLRVAIFNQGKHLYT